MIIFYREWRKILSVYLILFIIVRLCFDNSLNNINSVTNYIYIYIYIMLYIFHSALTNPLSLLSLIFA